MAGSNARGRGGAPSGRRPAAQRRFNYPRSGKGRLHRWVPSWRFVLGSFLFLAAIGVGTVITAYVTTDVPSPGEFTSAQTTTIYYSDGETEMGKFAEFNREIVDTEEIPQHVKDAIVAAEDRSFYDNAGVSPTGIARAFWVNVRGGNRQGASTITQQYAERYFLGDTTNYVGKFKEAILALKLAQAEDKDKILTNYLNTIYFGRGTYGIQTAAQAYFDVDAKDLTVAQGALIAGVVPAPSAWDPRLSPEKAESRWNYVVDGMVTTGSLTQVERDELEYPKTIKIKKSNALGGPKGYILEAAKEEVLKNSPIAETELDTRGLKIITTIDVAAQKSAVASIKEMPDDVPKGLQTAIVSIEPGDGAIRAMYAGDDFVEVQRNRVTQDIAQAGSTFKPFTLVAALENGWTLDSRLNGNSGRQFPGLETPVNNFAGINYGNVSLLKATQDSINTAYVDLNLEIGPDNSREAAVRAGIPEDAQDLDGRGLNVLGVASVHPIDMADAYATFAAEGMHAEPYIVASVTELDGSDVYTGGEVPTRAFEADVMAETTYALTQVVEQGSGSTAKALDRPVAGKTGTASKNKSAWFVGYTPQLATAVALYQIGEDGAQDPITPFGGYSEITGGSVPLDVWTAYMTGALEDQPVEQFPERGLLKPEPKPKPTTEPTATEEPTVTDEPTEEETTPPPDENPSVPSGVVGGSVDAARAALGGVGLEAIVREEQNEAPAGTVIRLEPGEGAEVPEGSSIVIVVSSGPPKKTEPPEEPSEPPAEPTEKPSDSADKKSDKAGGNAAGGAAETKGRKLPQQDSREP